MILLKWADNPSARLKIPSSYFPKERGTLTILEKKKCRIKRNKNKNKNNKKYPWGSDLPVIPPIVFLKRSLRAWQQGKNGFPVNDILYYALI